MLDIIAWRKDEKFEKEDFNKFIRDVALQAKKIQTELRVTPITTNIKNNKAHHQRGIHTMPEKEYNFALQAYQHHSTTQGSQSRIDIVQKEKKPHSQHHFVLMQPVKRQKKDY